MFLIKTENVSEEQSNVLDSYVYWCAYSYTEGVWVVSVLTVINKNFQCLRPLHLLAPVLIMKLKLEVRRNVILSKLPS